MRRRTIMSPSAWAWRRSMGRCASPESCWKLQIAPCTAPSAKVAIASAPRSCPQAAWYVPRPMTDQPDTEQPDQAPTPEPTSDKADLMALGIGCLVVLIMFVAIVIVA